MSDPLKALVDRVTLLEAQTFFAKSTLPPLVENPDGLPSMIFPGGGVDYDYLFVGTTKVTPPAKTTNFLQITLGASPSAAWVEAMPETEGSNTVTIDVTKNRIYLSGEFAG